MTLGSQKHNHCLYIWPRTESSLSLDPSCVAALLFLQTYIPGQFEVKYSANPDVSPTGQLPYLTHGMHSVTGYHAIVKYISSVLHDDTVMIVDPVQRAQAAARMAHIEANLGDLASHILYALTANWVNQTKPILVSMLPVPQKYYIPDRVRFSHKPRLESAELWNISAIEQEEKAADERISFRKAFKKGKKAQEKAKSKETLERNKVLDKARSALTIYSKLLGDSRFFYEADKPTMFDILLAGHIHLLKQDQPDPLIKDLLLKEYPTLVTHADAVYTRAFPEPSVLPATTESQPAFSFRSLFPSLAPKYTGPTSPLVGEQERRFALMRRAFYSGTLLIIGAYVYLQRETLNRFIASIETAHDDIDDDDDDEDS